MGSILRYSGGHDRFVVSTITHMIKISSIFHKNHSANTSQLRRDHFWHEIGENPFVDWAIILSLSVLVSIVLVAVGAKVYVDGAVELSSAPPIVATESLASHFDLGLLGRITNAFDARAAERVLLTQGYSGPSDPSLP
jgi:hypothetical protein